MSEYAFLEKYTEIFGMNQSGESSWGQVFQAILAFAGETIRETHSGVLLILGVCVLTLFFKTDLQPNSQNMMKYTLLVMTAVCAFPVVRDFLEIASVARETISEITTLMVASVPGLISLKISPASGVFLFITQITGTLMLSVFLPMILCYTGIGICDTVTERFKLSGIRQMVKSIFTWGLGTVMLIFSITSSISGVISGAGATNVGRSLRYAGSMIPVVGRYLSESAEMIYASGVTMKSTLGLSVTMAVIGCTLMPFVRIMIYVFVYKILSFMIKPFGYSSICGLTETVAEGFIGLAGITVLTAAIGLINVSVIVRSIGIIS